MRFVCCRMSISKCGNPCRNNRNVQPVSSWQRQSTTTAVTTSISSHWRFSLANCIVLKDTSIGSSCIQFLWTNWNIYTFCNSSWFFTGNQTTGYTSWPTSLFRRSWRWNRKNLNPSCCSTWLSSHWATWRTTILSKYQNISSQTSTASSWPSTLCSLKTDIRNTVWRYWRVWLLRLPTLWHLFWVNCCHPSGPTLTAISDDMSMRMSWISQTSSSRWVWRTNTWKK